MSWSTAIIFALCGIIFGTWSASIPSVRMQLGLNEAELGSVILFFSVGVISGNPASVPVMRRLGIFGACMLGVVGSLIAFTGAVAALSSWTTALALTFGGFMFSILNVGMNSAASLIEQATHRKIMSTCHGMWSLGAMVGSAACSAVLSTGVKPIHWFILGIGTFSLFILLVVSKGLRSVTPLAAAQSEANTTNEKRKFHWPTALLWSLIAISLCTNLTEGTMADWAAIFMRDEVGSEVWLEGWGFSVYALCMASTRFIGDRLLTRYRAQDVLKYGGILACAGFLLAIWTQTTVPTLIGFGMIGAGVALSAPILYGASARVPGMPPGAGLATMNTFAMVGFLSGPALIGFIARAASLPVAFAIVAAVCLFWVWRSGNLKHLP
jgi:MFS family permease